jgi:uncharacterized membrane protein YqjE
MADQRAGAPPRAGLRSTVARLADSALALVRTRAALAAVELEEERARLTRTAMFVAGAALMFSFAALGVGALVVVWFWDTHRLLAIAGVTLAYAIAGAWLLSRNNASWRDAPKPFAQTIAEFDKDREMLKGSAAANAAGAAVNE